MYCTNCGKETVDNETLCAECKAIAMQEGAQVQEQPQVVEAQVVEEQPQLSEAEIKKLKNAGVGRSVLGLIFSILGMIFMISAVALIGVALAMEQQGITTEDELTVVKGLALIGAGLMVLAIFICIPTRVFGIIAIVKFARKPKPGHPRPVKAFVLAIIGMAIAFSLVLSLGGGNFSITIS